MPEETGQTPVEVQADTPPVATPQPDTLPDNVPEVNADADKVRALEEKARTLEEKFNSVAKEKEELAARLKDNQEYISRTRKVEQTKPDVPLPIKTFDDYLADIDKIVDTDFENDPKAGLKKVARKLATDVAFDRDLERQENEKRLAEMEANTVKRVLKLDPEKARVMSAVEKLEADRPDLASLTFDQKLEWVRMAEGMAKPQQVNRTQINREHDLTSDVGGGRMSRQERIPSWASDPAVMREAQGHFRSKQEMIDWANVENAEQAKVLISRKGQV